MNITVTGAFAINTGTETFSFYKPNTYGISDDLTIVRGNHQYGVGGAVSLSNWKTESNVRSMGPISFNGGATGLPLADFLIGRIFDTASRRRSGRISPALFRALRAGHLARVAADHPELRRPVGTVVPAAQQEPRVLQLRHRPAQCGGTQQGVSQCAPRSELSRRRGIPGTAGMCTEWPNVAPRMGVSWDPKGDGRTAIRAGSGMNSNFIAGEFYFDAGPGAAVWSRTAVDQPSATVPGQSVAGAAGRPTPSAHAGAVAQKVDSRRSPALAPGSVPYDLETTRVHSWNIGLQQQFRREHGPVGQLSGNSPGQRVGQRRRGIRRGVLPAGLASPDEPLHAAQPPASPTGTTTYPNCSTAPIDVRRELRAEGSRQTGSAASATWTG